MVSATSSIDSPPAEASCQRSSIRPTASVALSVHPSTMPRWNSGCAMRRWLSQYSPSVVSKPRPKKSLKFS